MPVFNTLEDLENALVALEAERSFARYLIETARPALRLIRRPQPDNELPVAASKFGGDPDLPADMTWPVRPPFPDAAERRETLLRLADERESRGEPYASLAAKCRMKAETVGQPFPLAFICQLDLASLSRHAEHFDPLLPTEGRLLVFLDSIHWRGGIAGDRGAARLIYDNKPLALLTRRHPPDPIRHWYERIAFPGEPTRYEELVEAGLYEAIPAVSVTHHWKDFDFPEETRAVFYDLYTHQGKVTTRAAKPGNDFGDRLGGWANAIQHHPETEAQLAFHGFSPKDLSSPEARTLADRATDEWRHVLTLSCERWSKTRVLLDGRADANLFVMMREEDLRARRFENAWVIYQSD